MAELKTPSAVGRTILAARTAKKLSRYRLAVAADTTPQAIYDIETGTTQSPRFDLVMRLLGALDLEPSDIKEDVA